MSIKKKNDIGPEKRGCQSIKKGYPSRKERENRSIKKEDIGHKKRKSVKEIKRSWS